MAAPQPGGSSHPCRMYTSTSHGIAWPHKRVVKPTTMHGLLQYGIWGAGVCCRPPTYRFGKCAMSYGSVCMTGRLWVTGLPSGSLDCTSLFRYRWHLGGSTVTGPPTLRASFTLGCSPAGTQGCWDDLKGHPSFPGQLYYTGSSRRPSVMFPAGLPPGQQPVLL